MGSALTIWSEANASNVIAAGAFGRGRETQRSAESPPQLNMGAGQAAGKEARARSFCLAVASKQAEGRATTVNGSGTATDCELRGKFAGEAAELAAA